MTGRPSINLNEVNHKFTPKYHNRGNTKTFLGKQMSLGGAMALLATIRHGPLLPTDDHATMHGQNSFVMLQLTL